MSKSSQNPPPASLPPERPIPWLALAVAVLGGGVIGWAVANGGFSRGSARPPEPAKAVSILPAAKPAPAPAPAPGQFPPLPPSGPTVLNAAQSNAVFNLTNRTATAQVPAANPAPPSLLTAPTQPGVVPAARVGETLYNGIVLPEVWPPKGEFQAGQPMPVPYLSNPPPVIDITLGRQLFVDDFLIETSTLKRVWHAATLHSNNPVLKPERDWEKLGSAMAMPFSDGVWLDPMNWVSPVAFKAAEVQDVFGILDRIKSGTNALGSHLGTAFSASAQAQLKEFKGTNMAGIEAMQKLLAEELNRLITGPALFEAKRFEGVKLSDRSGALLARTPQGAQLQRLNRWLIEDAFPRELFRMQPVFTCHYMAGYGRGTALAISTNGFDWEKPEFDVKPGSNLVQTDPRDSSTVWLDQDAADPKQRYKMWRSHGSNRDFGLSLHFSEDGIHWGPPALRTGSAGDRSTVFWNPFRKVWSYSLRHGWEGERARRYWEVKDLLAGPHWKDITEPAMWVGSDRLDPMRADLQVTPQLYNLDAVGYESLMVGLFTVWRGDKNVPEGRPKPNSVWLGFSRDGYHWDRPDRRPFLDVSEKKGDWNWGNVQSVAGGFQVVGRNLHFYFSGRAGVAGQRDGGGAMGLATLRRDGFASMDAGPEGGVLTTRPVKFNARFLFVNMKTNAPDGELRIEILHADGRPITVTQNATKEQLLPFTKELSGPLAGDQTLMGASWQSAAKGQPGMQDLSMLAGRTVRFRFHLKNASLYSFWIGPGQLGRSHGPVAAGGPNFTGSTDTIGNGAYRPFPAVPRPHAPPPTNSVAAPLVPPAPLPPATPATVPKAPTPVPVPANPPVKK